MAGRRLFLVVRFLLPLRWHIGSSDEPFGSPFEVWRALLGTILGYFFELESAIRESFIFETVLEVSWESQDEVFGFSFVTFVYLGVSKPICGGPGPPSCPFWGPPGRVQGCFRYQFFVVLEHFWSKEPFVVPT